MISSNCTVRDDLSGIALVLVSYISQKYFKLCKAIMHALFFLFSLLWFCSWRIQERSQTTRNCGSLHQIMGLYPARSLLLITQVINLHMFSNLWVWFVSVLNWNFNCLSSSDKVTGLPFSSYKWRAKPNAFWGMGSLSLNKSLMN